MAAPPEGQVIEELHSLEVRWILPGRLEPAVVEWFGRFPSKMAARQDAYLLDPDLVGLSVKVRSGTALEVKVYRGSRGVLDVPGRAHGRLESWQKWSFPLGRLNQDRGAPGGWTVIRKTRRVTRLPLASGQAVAAALAPTTEPACTVELTEIGSGVQAWWSLAFEATGPAERLRNILHSTAVQIFAQALPGGMELGMSDCQSYLQWLSRHLEPRLMEVPAR